MTDSIEIIPTVVPKDAEGFANAVALVKSFAGAIHLDISDGVFTPAISWPYSAAGEFNTPAGLSMSAVRIEAHMMVQNAREIGDVLAQAGIFRIIGHIEAFSSADDARNALESWRNAGSEAGISILADTTLEALEPIVSACDVVQVMSVAMIGAQGAAFDPRATARIGELHAKYPSALISADGGVSMGNIASLARVGARRFSVGSAIMKNVDPAREYQVLKSSAEAVIP